MKSGISVLLAAAFLGAAPARSEDRAGAFDYYVLALSWTAAWCAAEGEARGAGQCDPRHDHGFLVHGLWPQHERGWPENCRAVTRDPSRRETRDVEDLFGDDGLAWYQWKKHGRCAGLDPAAYFALVRAAYEAVERPPILRQVREPLRIDADVIEAAFLEANPDLSPDGVTVTCRGGAIREVRICLTKGLVPRDCAADIRRDCPLDDAVFHPMR